ncbi:lysophospholipid acyltransferase family protein [Cyanobium sp. Aljojuca 7D2]|nr:lysophospholipid acyltransferase family protein [Cyanobium sp. Aljojuca 7D2]
MERLCGARYCEDAGVTGLAKKRTLLNNRLLATVAGFLLNAYAEVFRLTSRIRIQAHPEVDRLVKEQGIAVIYALWHRHAFFVPLLRSYGGRSMAVLLSTHRDAQIVAVAVRLRGLTVVSGSSTRGGLKAYRLLRRLLEQRQSVCITPDGPKGPAELVKSGVIHLAQQSGCAIVPVSVFCSRAHRLRSWDRSVLPLPFARVVLQLGEPLHPRAGLAEGQALLADRLHATAALVGEGSP